MKRSSRLAEKEARERSEREATERAKLEEEAAERERLKALLGYSPLKESKRIDEEEDGVTERERRTLARSERRIIDAAKEAREAEKEAKVAAIAEQYQLQMQGTNTENIDGRPKSPLKIILRRQDEGTYDSALVATTPTEEARVFAFSEPPESNGLQHEFTHPSYSDSPDDNSSSSMPKPKEAAVSKSGLDPPQQLEEVVRKEDAKLLTDFSVELVNPEAVSNRPAISSQIPLKGPINPP